MLQEFLSSMNIACIKDVDISARKTNNLHIVIDTAFPVSVRAPILDYVMITTTNDVIAYSLVFCIFYNI